MYKGRDFFSNPFTNKSINERLVKSGAIDMFNNSVKVECNGYCKFKPIDENKLLKS